MSRVDDLISQEKKEYEAITSLNTAIRQHRYHGATQRNNLFIRLQKAEQAYRSIYAELLKLGASAPYSLYQRQLPARHNGVSVTVELSLDGFAFSNPAPAVPHGVTLYVRAKIEENHTGFLGIPKSHLLYHVTWKYSKTYTPLDGVSASGRDEFVVSNPLIITRPFKSPSSGSTKHNFFVYVDVYNPVG